MLGDGAARGATPGPCRARRSRKIHRLPSPFSPRPRVLSREHSPPRHLLAALVRGALFAVSPRLYYPTDAVRRSYSSSSSLFLRFFRSSPPPPLFSPELSCPPTLYRVLLSHSLFLVSSACTSRALRVSSSCIFRFAPASSQRRFLRQVGYIQADELRLCRPTGDHLNASSGIS